MSKENDGWKIVAIDKFKDMGNIFKAHIADLALATDNSKAFREYKNLWLAKEKIDEAISLVTREIGDF
jgi:hypothetical protein